MTTRYFTRSRSRLAHDEQEGTEQLRAMLDDPDLDLGDLIAACIEHCPESKMEEVYDAVRGLSSDTSPRSWAADRLERKKLSRDMRERRARDKRLGKDDPEPFPGRPRPGGGMDPFDDRGYPVESFGRSEADRQIREAAGTDRRMGRDMAMDGSSAVLRYISGR